MPKCNNFWWRGQVFNIEWEVSGSDVSVTTTPHNPELVEEIKRRAREAAPLGFNIYWGFLHYSFPEDANEANRAG